MNMSSTRTAVPVLLTAKGNCLVQMPAAVSNEWYLYDDNFLELDDKFKLRNNALAGGWGRVREE